MRDVLIGATDYTVLVKIIGTDGAPETGLTEASIDIAYARVETDNDVTTTDVTPAALSALTDAHTDWGFEEVSSGDHPGLYRLDIADAVFASGAWEAVVTIVDASGTDFYAVDIGFRLVGSDPQVALGTAAELAKVPKSDGTASWNATALEAIEQQVDDALLAAGFSTVTDIGDEVDTRLETMGLDHLISASVTGTDIADNSIIARLASKSATADWDSYSNTTDSLEAASDQVGTMAANRTLQEVFDEVQAVGITATAVVADTNELQTDWADGGRLDVILDARASQTSVNTVDDLLDTEMPALTAAMVKVQAAVYDSATVSGDVITLSNAATQTVTESGRVTA